MHKKRKKSSRMRMQNRANNKRIMAMFQGQAEMTAARSFRKDMSVHAMIATAIARYMGRRSGARAS